MTKHRRELLHLFMIALFLHSAPALKAQPAMLQRAREGSASSSVVLNYWKVEENNVRQIAIPITFLYPVNEQLQLSMSTGPAFSTLESSGSTALNGFSDTRVGGSYLFRNERLLGTFGLNLPSGKHALKTEEFNVASVLALHAFDFAMPILGQGLDLSAGLASAHPLSGMVVGFGAGFLMRGAFEPIENASTKYNPGEEFTVSGSIDYPLAQRKKLMMDLSYTIYTADKIKDSKIYQAGNRVTAQVMAWFPGERAGLLFTVRDRIRAKNKMISGADLIPERQNSNGNELELLAMITLPRGSFTTLRGVVEGKFYGNNAYDIGGATIGGAGIGLSKTFTPHLSLEVDARFYAGSLKTVNEPANLIGLKATGGFKFRL